MLSLNLFILIELKLCIGKVYVQTKV